MDAKMCDRCGKLYKIYHSDVTLLKNGIAKGSLTIKANGIELMDDMTGVRHLDFCPQCLSEFVTWATGAPLPAVMHTDECCLNCVHSVVESVTCDVLCALSDPPHTVAWNGAGKCMRYERK